jgi:hypothetical protein
MSFEQGKSKTTQSLYQEYVVIRRVIARPNGFSRADVVVVKN